MVLALAGDSTMTRFVLIDSIYREREWAAFCRAYTCPVLGLSSRWLGLGQGERLVVHGLMNDRQARCRQPPRPCFHRCCALESARRKELARAAQPSLDEWSGVPSPEIANAISTSPRGRCDSDESLYLSVPLQGEGPGVRGHRSASQPPLRHHHRQTSPRVEQHSPWVTHPRLLDLRHGIFHGNFGAVSGRPTPGRAHPEARH